MSFGIVYLIDEENPAFVEKSPSIVIFKEGKKLSKQEGNMTRKVLQLYFKEIMANYLDKEDRKG
ncbi:MAG TPA: hypothetical protein HA362_01670 [Nanoarchaeota archaeon]|nr:hypothetical protein [Nanoarchaeota archaeon]